MCCTDAALAYVEAHASWSEANTRPSLGRNYEAFVSRHASGEARADFAVEGGPLRRLHGRDRARGVGECRAWRAPASTSPTGA